MMDVTVSVEGVPIRLTHERWFHIVENHDDVAGYYDDVLETIENPDLVLRGYRGTLIAVRSYGRRPIFNGGVSPSVCRRWLHHHCVFHEQT